MLIALPKSSSAIQFLLLAALPVGAAMAEDFPTTISSSTKAQTLAESQTGTVAAGGTLTVASDKVAVTFTGKNATLNNLGTIAQTGTGRGIRDNTGLAGLVVNNGSSTNSSATITTADGDVIQAGKAGSSITLNNYGTMTSFNASGGGQVVDFNSVTAGVTAVNNYGTMTAYEADAIRTGNNTVVTNAGTIRAVTAKYDSSDAIDLQENTSGVKIFNTATGLIEGGRAGIAGGPKTDVAFTLSVSNELGGVIRGLNGSGINLDGVSGKQVVTIVNGGSIIGEGVTGDGDGIDVDGIANITNTGLIRSANAFASTGETKAYSEGISVGGGTIVNAGTIEGLVGSGNTVAVGRGITLAGNDIKGAAEGTREGLYGNAVITNQSGGVIYGQSDSAIVAVGAASAYTVTINNNAGASIIGGGTQNAAIKGGLDNTTIVTGGLINGSSSGKAIELGSGVNHVTITGGIINGSINGGSGGQNTLVVNPGTNNGFAYAGAISNFSKVEVQSGNVTFSGVSSYSGATVLSGGELTLDGAQRLSADSELILDGGTLRLSHAGADGQTFASLSLSSNSSVFLGGSSLTFGALGAVVNGATLSFSEAVSGVYAFRLLGDYTSDSSFLALLNGTHINGLGAVYTFDGIYTNVTAAVPEPSTYAMLFAGLGLMGMVARRRRHKA